MDLQQLLKEIDSRLQKETDATVKSQLLRIKEELTAFRDRRRTALTFSCVIVDSWAQDDALGQALLDFACRVNKKGASRQGRPR